MTYIKRELPTEQRHRCAIPKFVSAVHDLWRCDECGKLWQCVGGCRYRRLYDGEPHVGQHIAYLEWIPATLWQRWKHRKEGKA